MPILKATTDRYCNLITEGFNCICSNNIPYAISLRAQINQLLRTLNPMPNSKEVLGKRSNLYQMSESLVLLIRQV